jgi:hypothetical protein
MARGARELYDETRRYYDQGTQYYHGVANSIVGSLSPALVSAAGDVRNLGKYMREFASNAMRQIAELTTRMLLFRAVAGIGNSFFGGSAAGTPTGVTSANSFGLAVDGAFANTGGFITRSGVRRYAGGGYVPGPNVNRDVVPALLTPGEFVLNRAATARAGVANLARFNRGGAVGGGVGVGGGVVVNQTVVVQGGAGGRGSGGEVDGRTLESLKAATRDGVLEALMRSPGYRERMRAALA